MTAFARGVLAALLAGSAASCAPDAFLDMTDRYARVGAVNVRLACRDTYEVFDRADLYTLLVRTSAVTELVVCGDGTQPPLPERQRRVAEIFLAETSKRPNCRLTGDRELTGLHREFTYACR